MSGEALAPQNRVCSCQPKRSRRDEGYMLTTLRNEHITVTADTHGGEMQSLVSADGYSYLWTGDPAYWGYRAPSLFPIVGALRNKQASSDGGPISLPQHGFCRTSDLEIESTTETAVTYLLRDSEKTRAGYPYAFELRITHELCGAGVTTRYTVTNTDTKPLPFFVGGHPAFRIPLDEGEGLEDYRLEFPNKETIDCPQVDLSAGLIIDTVRNRLLTDGTTVALNHVMFRGDALIFDQLKSRSVRLYSAKSERGVAMQFADMPYLAVWTKSTDAPLLCLEPWTGMATTDNEDDVLEHKRGVTILQPGEEKRYSFTVTVF